MYSLIDLNRITIITVNNWFEIYIDTTTTKNKKKLNTHKKNLSTKYGELA